MCGYSRAVWCGVFFFSSRRRHTRFDCDWSSDVCSSDLRSIVGSVYKGVVTNVLPGMQAAFVDIGLHKDGFLYAGDYTINLSDYARAMLAGRSEERRVGKECRSRWSPYH